MIVAFSTSSPMVSVAVMHPDGRVWEATTEAPRAASSASLELLEQLLGESEAQLSQVTDWVADVGPGSFIGVRVGVMLAKTLAMVHGSGVRGASSFDLISTTQTVAFPSRRGEWFVRRPGEEPVRTSDLPTDAIGYGLESDEPTYPSAARARDLIAHLPRMRPEELRPEPLMEPSISQPKVPYRRADA